MEHRIATYRYRLLGLLAAVSLSAGVLFYLLARPAGHILLLPAEWPSGALVDTGLIGDSLPTLLHAFAMTLMIALVMRPPTRAGLAAIGGAWFTVEAVFEIGQHRVVSDTLASSLPGTIMHAPLLEHLLGYFRHGTFDPLDITAALAGACAACLIYHLTLSRKGGHHEQEHHRA